MNIKTIMSLMVAGVMLAACGGTGSVQDYNSNTFLEEESLGGAYSDNAQLMAPGAKYYIGNPYTIEGVQYIPVEDFTYNQVGIAGIVPAELNGVQTTNGETFNINSMMATSKTLPLPTIARVTNLENGQSVLVRVNNRGPFVNSRIMDVSPAAARRLGMTGQTKVQVQVMANESLQLKNSTTGANALMADATTVAEPVLESAPEQPSAGGPYAVQLGAFYSEDGANSLVRKVAYIGRATVIEEGGMFKVRISGLDASAARNTIDTLRSDEGMSPGLLMNGRWINADSI